MSSAKKKSVFGPFLELPKSVQRDAIRVFVLFLAFGAFFGKKFGHVPHEYDISGILFFTKFYVSFCDLGDHMGLKDLVSHFLV